MHFPYSFPQAMMAYTSGSTLVLDVANKNSYQVTTSGMTAFLQMSNGGTVTGKTTTTASATPFKIINGSYFPNDKISPTLGGFKELHKSKVINPAKILRVVKQTAKTKVNQEIAVGWDNSVTGATSGVSPDFEAGKSYNLRIDAKGSPALRFLNHNAYYVLPAYTGCPTDTCTSGCTATYVDGTTVYLQWKDVINKHPWLPNFIEPHVYVNSGGTKTEVYSDYDVNTRGVGSTVYTAATSNPQNVISSINLKVVYSPTTFGDSTFTVTDHYELEPLLLNVSLVDWTQDPCDSYEMINQNTAAYISTGKSGKYVTEITAPVVPVGYGESVLRDLIKSIRYQTTNFPDGEDIDVFRMREIEGYNWLFSAVTRSAYYDSVTVYYEVPERGNFSNVMPGNTYAHTMYVPTGTTTTTYTNFLINSASAAGKTIVLETI